MEITSPFVNSVFLLLHIQAWTYLDSCKQKISDCQFHVTDSQKSFPILHAKIIQCEILALLQVGLSFA